MANTYSQLYAHVIFAVKNREALIREEFKEELYKYISGIVNHKGQKLFAINGMPDHIHILLSLSPDCPLSELVREIKKSSNGFIKEKGLFKFPFAWQAGYGAFSIGASQISKVVNYIENQERHHTKKSFEDEYRSFLENYQVDFKDEYLFEFFKK
ncbi:IS200/IS605 family transposase [Owenweeksia hongkongensis]|uniref:IS200/IS605 family transposase n=1 Tax=Owenweeksia hongkongensis TaxID=253245 RepID=UPI003A8EC08D